MGEDYTFNSILSMNDSSKNFGLDLNPIVPGDHYVLGGYSGITDRSILMPKGHGWGAYKPASELQNRYGLETMNCTVFGTHNALETLAKFHGFVDFPNDCSERYNGVMCATTPWGNDPHDVIETIRTVSGVIPEQLLPWTDDIDTWDEYYHPRPMDSTLKGIGQSILKRFKISHEWLFNGSDSDKASKLINGLERGTVALTMYAWRVNGTLYYKNPTDVDNHWLQLLDYKEKQYWILYDHYEEVEKKIAWNTDFNAAKVFYMENIEQTTPKTFFDKLWDSFTKLFISRV